VGYRDKGAVSWKADQFEVESVNRINIIVADIFSASVYSGLVEFFYA